MSEILPPAMTHGKHSKAILWGSVAAGGVLLYLFMHRSAAGQVAAATPADAGTGAPVDSSPVSGSPAPSYGGDGGGYGDASNDGPPLTVGSTDVAPGAPSSGAHPTTVHHHKAPKHEVSHPAQVHTNPVHHANVRHKNEVMNSHHGGANTSAHTEHHASPVPASNHHHKRGH